MNIAFSSFCGVHLLGESATGVIAHFSGLLGVLLLLAECSPRRRRPCRAHDRLQAVIVRQASRMRLETPATPYPEGRKNAHSRLSNYRF